MTPHAVARLRAERLARSTRPYTARGAGSARCGRCRLADAHCICAEMPRPDALPAARAAICLLMHGEESMRPSNTGWLVADVLPSTACFEWSRTAPGPALLALLADPSRSPVVVFPADDCAPERVVAGAPRDPARPPLFVILDGTWAEARKMFRKSAYLASLPVLALDPAEPSRYGLRRTPDAGSLCTAEVAASCLRLSGDGAHADALGGWLAAFVAATRRHRGLG
ncbi:MAG: hypothetical protein HMLKMBBP_00365 [Planctomycetes bacterium]|nr:hypothetical protein [Planctomycetota bacterium]